MLRNQTGFPQACSTQKVTPEGDFNEFARTSLTLESVQGFILLMLQTNGTLHSGELAKAAGVSPDTVRHYEKIGILPSAPRGSSGYRVYPPSAVNRVQVVQRALRIGFTLRNSAKYSGPGMAEERRVSESLNWRKANY